jgi:hypothetical protein
MANMELITSVTVGSGGAASVTLPATGTIPQTYTDLKLVMSVRDSGSGTEQNMKVSFNGVGGTSYSSKLLYGSGSGAASYSSSSAAFLEHQYANASGSTANTFSNNEIYIPNYTSSNYKSVSVDTVVETNATASSMGLSAGLFSNTGAITTINLAPFSGSNTFLEGSTFYLYGISNVTSGSKATGGIVSSDGTYWYHMFPYSGTFTPTVPLTADYLVIAGGGAGGTVAGNAVDGGGGGAGGLRSTVGATGGGGSLETALSLSATPYTVTVGAGGAIGTWPGPGSNGNDSTFSTITSVGGGRAGQNNSTYRLGASGGSGGGGGHATSGGVGQSGGSATPSGQGYAGGSGSTQDNNGPTGGGGGAGGVGGSTSGGALAAAGAGGVGVAISAFANATQTGVNTYYAGGGGGGSAGTVTTGIPALGGLGGGGNGAYNGLKGITGAANTGGGGGGGAYPSTAPGNIEYAPGAGGSGLVIIRYAI